MFEGSGNGFSTGAISYALRFHLDVKNAIEKNWKFKPSGYFLNRPYVNISRQQKGSLGHVFGQCRTTCQRLQDLSEEVQTWQIHGYGRGHG